MNDQPDAVPELFRKHEKELLAQWMEEQLKATTLRPELLDESELRRQSAEFLILLRDTTLGGIPSSLEAPQCRKLTDMLASVTRSRVQQGFSPVEVATFVFSIKQPLFRLMSSDYASDMKLLNERWWEISVFLDKLGLYTTDIYQKIREDIIKRQQAELLELSTPVVELWKGVLALPLIGTLDSARTQVVMESLLERLVETQASIAIIDITGVPTVDTNVAKHLLKTVTAARLMGAECMISGISPAIAQTMVHLGVDLAEVPTKASLATALKIAMQKIGLKVVSAVDEKKG